MYPLKTKNKYIPWKLDLTWDIYTTVYLWNYVSWNFDEFSWSHPWVDIMPQVKNDNIYACLDWKIFFAWESDSNWKYIIMEHKWVPDPDDFSKKTDLYSSHLHLSELNVQTWDDVKEGYVIWKSWNTWNSTWEHLHFQIDRKEAPFFPYWPFSFTEAQEMWMWFFEAVNFWLWRENWIKFTINPLVYLDKIKSANWEKSTEVVDSIEEPDVISTPITTSVDETTPIEVIPTKSQYFDDVTEYIKEIDYLVWEDIINGYADWTFRPNANITRQELLWMVLKFAKTSLINDSTNKFSDVSEDEWWYKYISTASHMWIINWYTDWTFKPNNPITRSEAVWITLNAIIWKQNFSSQQESYYQDVKPWDWYCKYTNYVAENWLLDSVWMFYPLYNLKRKELALLLYNLRDKV